MGKFTALEQAELTKNWSLEEKSALAHFLQKMEFAKNETIFASKSEDQILYLIETGVVRLAYENTSIDLQSGESFAELSLLQKSPKKIGAIPLAPTVVWILTFDKWEDMKRAAPVISLKLMEEISRKMARLLNNSLPPHEILTTGAKASSKDLPPTSFEFQ